MESHIADITRVIQLSVAPAFLLVAIGNLLMILSARLGRIVDRRRVLEDRLGGLSGDAVAAIETELAHLHRRAVLIHVATLSAVKQPGEIRCKSTYRMASDWRLLLIDSAE